MNHFLIIGDIKSCDLNQLIKMNKNNKQCINYLKASPEDQKKYKTKFH